MHHAVRHLRSQLDQATARIRTLEAELKHGKSKAAAHTEVNGSEDWASVSIYTLLSNTAPVEEIIVCPNDCLSERKPHTNKVINSDKL